MLVHFNPCVVCMKPARGRHYNVFTCDGCKSFFRRAIVKNLKYAKCRFGEKCYLDITHEKPPKTCQWCRMQKCWESGMQRRDRDCHIKEVRDVTWLISKIRNSLLYVESKLAHLRCSTYNPVKFPNIEEIIEAPVLFNRAHKFEAMSGWPLSEQEFFEKQKTLTDTVIMLEDCHFSIPNTHNKSINTKDWLPFDLLLSAHYVKTFSFFNNLSHPDKTRLIRATSIQVASIMLFFKSYQNKMADIQLPDGIVFNGAFMKNVYESILAVKLDEHFLKIFDRCAKVDVMQCLIRDKITYEEYIFLRTIIVCNPALTLSQHARDILEKERRKCGQALLNFCLLQHGGVNGPTRFVVVLNYVNIMIRHENKFRDLMVYLRLASANRVTMSRKRLEDDIFLSQ